MSQMPMVSQGGFYVRLLMVCQIYKIHGMQSQSSIHHIMLLALHSFILYSCDPVIIFVNIFAVLMTDGFFWIHSCQRTKN